MTTEIPELLASTDTIFHYTSSQIAIENILLKKDLRLSPRTKSSDLTEKIIPRISESIKIENHIDEAIIKKISQNVLEVIKKNFADFRQLCFCMNVEKIGINSLLKPYEYYGFLKPRMWDQYGENYKGVCLTFSKNKLIENSKIEVKDRIKYLTFEDFEKDYLEINQNDLNRLGQIKYTKELLNYAEKFLLRKHKDYSQENEYRLGLFSQNEYEDINAENCITGIIVIPAEINEYTQKKFIEYSKKMKIPLICLTLNDDGLRINKHRHCSSLIIEYNNRK